MKALIDGFSNALRSGAYMDRERALVGAGIFGAFSFLGLLFMALSRMVTAATSVSFALVILAALLLVAWRRARAPHQAAPA